MAQQMWWRAALAMTCAMSTTANARPDDPGSDLFTFDVGDEVLSFDSEHFRAHYALAGTHAVPAGDDDDSGVPDHVEDLLAIYEAVYAHNVEVGFRVPLSDDGQPDNGGDGRFDVYLVDFARSADGAYRAERCEGARCSGYMVQENDFAGYGYPSIAVANTTLASHEYFHAVQAAYDKDQGAVVAEGTAVWASERFDASLRDLEGFAYGYLDNASTPLDSGRGGPVDSFSYGAGIFFEFLSERFNDDVVRVMWEAVADDTAPDADWFTALNTVLEAEGSSFAAAFTEFSTWTLSTGARARDGEGFESAAQMQTRTGTDKTLPIAEASFTVFTSSSRLLAAPTAGRTEIAVGVGGDNHDGIHVQLATLNPAGDIVVLGDVDSTEAITTTGANQVLVLVVNDRQEGSSARPQLCVGTTDEVNSCLGAEDEGEGEGEGEGDVDTGGCTAVAPGSVGALLLVLRRRRR
jgi:hypothetical protein